MSIIYIHIYIYALYIYVILHTQINRYEISLTLHSKKFYIFCFASAVQSVDSFPHALSLWEDGQQEGGQVERGTMHLWQGRWKWTWLTEINKHISTKSLSVTVENNQFV